MLNFGVALAHPLRLKVLLAHANDGAASAKMLSTNGLDTLGNVSYHQVKLLRLGALRLTHTEKKKGALERHYTLTEFGKEIVKTAAAAGRMR
ncbi:MAG TPA: hypothetical protein VGI17_11250 [Solirubrobacterales bacterium]